MRVVALVLGVVLVGGGAALAQTPPRPGDADYGGVAPGTAPREKHHVKRGPGTLTWVGFQRVGDAPRVFVRVTSEVNPTQAVAGDELVVTLPGFKLDTTNNGRPLDTRWFGTRVVRVRAVPVKSGIEVRVTFAKGAGEAKITTEAATDEEGGFFVYLDFSA